MVVTEHSEVGARFSRIRRKLDDGGYLESFGLDSLRLVEHLFGDLVKTTESLQKTLLEYSHCKKVAEELECGVAPFKEENVRLYKENSHLRLGLAKALEEAEDKARDPTLRLRDLEAENNELKLLVSQFAERIKRSEAESLEKTRRIVKLQEKDLGPLVKVKGDGGKNYMPIQPQSNPTMEVDHFVADACPQCIRLRNYAEYGKSTERNSKTIDYMKMADSRIEALQLQLRSLKSMEKEHLTLITSLKGRVNTRESEIERLRDLIKVRPGRDNKVNAMSAYEKDKTNLNIELKTAEMQLQLLQRRNLELEDKLKKSIFQEHQEYMLGKTTSYFVDGNVARNFLEKELDKYPSHDKMSLLEKLYYLEQQLSHCCKEKAALKRKIEECQLKHVTPEKRPVIGASYGGKRDGRAIRGILTAKSDGVHPARLRSLKPIHSKKPPILRNGRSDPGRKQSDTPSALDSGKECKVIFENEKRSRAYDSEISEEETDSGGNENEHEDLNGADNLDSDQEELDFQEHYSLPDKKSSRNVSQKSGDNKTGKTQTAVSKQKSKSLTNVEMKRPYTSPASTEGSYSEDDNGNIIDLRDEDVNDGDRDHNDEKRKHIAEPNGKRRTPGDTGGRSSDLLRPSTNSRITQSKSASSIKTLNTGKVGAGGRLNIPSQSFGKVQPRRNLNARTSSRPAISRPGKTGRLKEDLVEDAQGENDDVQETDLHGEDQSDDAMQLNRDKEAAQANLNKRLQESDISTSRRAGGQRHIKVDRTAKMDPNANLKARSGKSEPLKRKETSRVKGDMSRRTKSDIIHVRSQVEVDVSPDAADESATGYYDDDDDEEVDEYGDVVVYESDNNRENDEGIDNRNMSHPSAEAPTAATGSRSTLPEHRTRKNGDARSSIPDQSAMQSQYRTSKGDIHQPQRTHSKQDVDQSTFHQKGTVLQGRTSQLQHKSSDFDSAEQGRKSKGDLHQLQRTQSKQDEEHRAFMQKGTMSQGSSSQLQHKSSDFDSAEQGRKSKGDLHQLQRTQSKQDDEQRAFLQKGTVLQGRTSQLQHKSSDFDSAEQGRKSKGDLHQLQRTQSKQDDEQRAFLQKGAMSQDSSSQLQHKSSDFDSAIQGRTNKGDLHQPQRTKSKQDGDQRASMQKGAMSQGGSSQHKPSDFTGTEPQMAPENRSRAAYATEKNKGISAVKEPSLLSISELERDHSDDDYARVDATRARESSNTGFDREVLQDKHGVVSNGNGRRGNVQRTNEAETFKPQYDNMSSGPDFQRGYTPETRNPTGEISTTDQRQMQRYIATARESSDQFSTSDQHFQDTRRGFVEREFSRGGVDDAVTSFGRESSIASYSRKPDDGGRNIQGNVMKTSSQGQPKYDDIRGFDDGRSSFQRNNPALGQRLPDERRSFVSVGINTESRQAGFSWSENRDESHEKRALVEKIAGLQRKLDEVHTESSRHQLKSFELQGELERTKHVLQVEKQERSLAVSELKRLREMNNESTARMLMGSVMGSDGSFRRGTTPMEMEREISNLRAALASLDRDKDEMRVELDIKDERMARLTNEASKYMDELSYLKLQLKNAELQINHTGESAKEQTREVELLKKQFDASRRDLEKTIRERDEALKDLHKLTGVHTKGQMERRSVETELELRNKEADDLRRQVQRYIDEVRRIEELLLDKEEEMETLIQHYRSLTAENSTLEAQRTSLEREASSIRDSVRDAVDQSISFKTQLASQNALVQALEEELQTLTQQVSQLENQVASKAEKEKMLEADVKASKDLIYRLEVQMDKLKLDLADSESKRKQYEAENEELNAHISALEARLEDETRRQQQLESLVANSREKDFQVERSTQGISRERDELSDKLTSLQQRSEQLNSEVSRYRLKSIELQSELDRTRRQLSNEKQERETAFSELRRIQEQLNSSSANYLLNTALGATGSSGSRGAANITDSSFQQEISPGSTFRPNLLQRGSSREPSPFTRAQDTPPSDFRLHPPIATSTSRVEEQPGGATPIDPSKDKDAPQTQGHDDTFEEWDTPPK